MDGERRVGAAWLVAWRLAAAVAGLGVAVPLLWERGPLPMVWALAPLVLWLAAVRNAVSGITGAGVLLAVMGLFAAGAADRLTTLPWAPSFGDGVVLYPLITLAVCGLGVRIERWRRERHDPAMVEHPGWVDWFFARAKVRLFLPSTLVILVCAVGVVYVGATPPGLPSDLFLPLPDGLRVTQESDHCLSRECRWSLDVDGTSGTETMPRSAVRDAVIRHLIARHGWPAALADGRQCRTWGWASRERLCVSVIVDPVRDPPAVAAPDSVVFQPGGAIVLYQIRPVRVEFTYS